MFGRFVDRLTGRHAAAPPTRSQQELCETAMALLTLWVTFDDEATDGVANTTRSLLAGMTTSDLGYLVLHMAGLSRGLARVMSDQGERDVSLALQAVARGVHERGVTG